jgi:hypothetical protein
VCSQPHFPAKKKVDRSTQRSASPNFLNQNNIRTKDEKLKPNQEKTELPGWEWPPTKFSFHFNKSNLIPGTHAPEKSPNSKCQSAKNTFKIRRSKRALTERPWRGTRPSSSPAFLHTTRSTKAKTNQNTVTAPTHFEKRN